MGVKILAAIDDRSNREQIKKALEATKRDYQVITTSDTASTLQKIKEDKPHLIIIDYDLDNSIGILAINTLKNDRTLAAIPVLLFVNPMHQKQIIDALDAGALGYIKKPLEKKVLIKRVNAIVDLIGTKVIKGGISSSIGNIDELVIGRYLLIAIGLLGLLGLLPAYLASQKGRQFIDWWFFGAVLFPVALPAALLIKPKSEEIQLQ